MRYGAVTIVALGAGLAVWLAAAGPAAGQPKPPADFTFQQGKDSPGPVTFSHTRHRAAGVEKCTECHTKLFKFKKGTSGPFTMARMKEGEICGACHNGKTTVKDKTVFSADDKQACANCHKK